MSKRDGAGAPRGHAHSALLCRARSTGIVPLLSELGPALRALPPPTQIWPPLKAGLQKRQGAECKTARRWTGGLKKEKQKHSKHPSSKFLASALSSRSLDSSFIPCYPHFQHALYKNTRFFSFCILLLKYSYPPHPTIKISPRTPIPFLHPPASPAQVLQNSLPTGHFGVCPLGSQVETTLWRKMEGGKVAPGGAYLRALATCS